MGMSKKITGAKIPSLRLPVYTKLKSLLEGAASDGNLR